MKKIVIIDDNLLSVEGICHGIDWTSMSGNCLCNIL